MIERSVVAEGRDELQVALATDGGFNSWYRRTVPRVYSYLLSRCGNDPALAEELTQQTFIAAIDRRSRYDGRSDTVTWLCGIARHKLADHYRVIERQERRQKRLEVREIRMAGAVAHAPGLDDRAAIEDAIHSLPVDQRAILVFVVLDDLPVAEAARLMGRSALAAQSLLHRARDGFKRAYRAENADE